MPDYSTRRRRRLFWEKAACAALTGSVERYGWEEKASGEQWSDQARQDLVSTVLISASREGLLQIWERPA